MENNPREDTMPANEEDYSGAASSYGNLPQRFLKDKCVLPLKVEDNIITLAMEDTGDIGAIEAVRLATGMTVRPVRGERAKILQALEGRADNAGFDEILEAVSSDGLNGFADDEDINHLRDLASEAPIIRLVNLIITKAIDKRASDIHVEPLEEILRVRYRIDDILHDVEKFPKRLHAAITSRIKIMANLDISERRLPQDGRMKMKISERDIDFRVATIPSMFGETVVFRILDRGNLIVRLEDLGLSSRNMVTYDRMLKKPYGIILVTGPTGSGKTTTLYTTLEKLNSPEKKIITIEDPVEYNLGGIIQIQVRQQIGFGFANGLRHIVRQDPNIVMVGEIRDVETAEIAVQSALTGHFVFSTLHTNDASGAIVRLLEMGIENYLLASSLVCVVAQRLVRVLCPKCKTRIAPTEVDLKMLEGLYEPGGSVTLYRANGCKECDMSGYRGRRAIFEVLPVGREIRELIHGNPESDLIKKKSVDMGMVDMREDGLRKVLDGVTTMEEIIRTTYEE